MRRWGIFLLAVSLHGETLSEYDVPGMHCPLCTVAVKRSLKSLSDVHRVDVRLNTKRARVWHADSLGDARLKEAIAATGYQGILLTRDPVPR